MTETAVCYRIIIPRFHFTTLNELMVVCKTRRATYAVRSRLKRGDADVLAGYSLGFPKAQGPRSGRLIITVQPEQRKPDGDAYFKSAWDALKTCHLIIDDSPRWFSPLPTEYIEERSEREWGTTIELRDL